MSSNPGRSILQVVLDGGADRKCPSLDGETPLQAASTPHLDELAVRNMTGLMDIPPAGAPMHSPTAHSIFWGVPLGDLPEWALFEVMGQGMSLEGADVIFSLNLVTGDTDAEGWTVGQYRPELSSRGVWERRYEDDPFERTYRGVGFTVRFESIRPRQAIGFVRVEGGTLPARLHVIDSDPFEDNFPLINPDLTADADSYTAAERKTVEAYLELIRALIVDSRDRLRGEPVDFIAPKWHLRPASHRDPVQFSQRWGIRGATCTFRNGLKGAARWLGMGVYDAPRDDFARRVRKCLDLAESAYEFVHCHFQEPDTVGHTNDPAGKAEVFERIDAALEPLVDWSREHTVTVTADHATPCRSYTIHGGDPVPLLVAGPDTRRDLTRRFDEVEAARGAIGHIRADTLMNRLMDWSGRSLFHDVSRTPHARSQRVPASRVTPFREG